MKILRRIIYSVGLAGLLLAALIAIQTPHAVQALPIRPEPTECKTPIKGGFIELAVDGATSEVWTAVQWQDPHTGDWHLVDGWRGSTNADHEVRWYVGQDDLGSGPFRWLVYDAHDGNMLITSDLFDLPEQSGQTIAVSVTLP